MLRPGRNAFYQVFDGRCIFVGIVLLLNLCYTKGWSQGNLLVMPRRVVFEGNNMRSQELNLANTGRDTARYIISILDIRMTKEGNFEVIDQPDSGQHFAGRFLRFFPHAVTLGPNESQVIKLQVSRTSELEPGEYRSHIYFRAVPEERTADVVEPSRDSAITIRIVPEFGISIPVIIRSGETSAQVELQDASIDAAAEGAARLNLVIARKGNRSVYGDLAVNFYPTQGKMIQIAAVKGIAVYTPNASRQIRLDLAKKAGVNYHAGRIQVVFSAPAETKYERYAETEWVLH